MNRAPLHTNALPILLGLVALTLSLSTSLAQAAEPWRSIRPDEPAIRLELRNIDPAVKAANENRTWIRAALGDTLVFRYRGVGEFRLDARPVMAAGESQAIVRYGVRFGTGEPRRFLRRSKVAGRYGLRGNSNGQSLPTSSRLGQVDRNTLSLDPSQQTIFVFLRSDGADEILVRGLVRGDVERLNTAYNDGPKSSRGEWSFDAAIGGGGYTDNAYLAPKNGVPTQGAGFWPADVGLRYRNREGLPFRFTADYEFGGRFYNDPILDERRHSAQLEQRWDFGRWGGLRDVQFTLSEGFKSKDDTFFGRGATDEFETSSVNGIISLADRFDFTDWEGEGELAFQASPTFAITTNARARRRNYDNDYSDDLRIDSLDQTRFDFDVEFAWEVTPSTTLSLDGGLELRNYDEKFSRDLSGANVIAEPTRLRRWPVEIQAEYAPKAGLQLSASLGSLVTRDLYVGYWDRSSVIYGGELGWKFSRRNQVSAWFRGSQTNYDNATVGFDPVNVIRDKSTVRFGVDAEYGLYRNADLIFEYSYEDLANNSPLFAYTRSEFVGGLVVKY
jgi:hypothetical protein